MDTEGVGFKFAETDEDSTEMSVLESQMGAKYGVLWVYLRAEIKPSAFVRRFT